MITKIWRPAGLTVCFDGLRSGTVTVRGESNWCVGDYYDYWPPHTDPSWVLVETKISKIQKAIQKYAKELYNA